MMRLLLLLLLAFAIAVANALIQDIKCDGLHKACCEGEDLSIQVTVQRLAARVVSLHRNPTLMNNGGPFRVKTLSLLD